VVYSPRPVRTVWHGLHKLRTFVGSSRNAGQSVTLAIVVQLDRCHDQATRMTVDAQRIALQHAEAKALPRAIIPTR
jgi:hypothetical protein